MVETTVLSVTCSVHMYARRRLFFVKKSICYVLKRFYWVFEGIVESHMWLDNADAAGFIKSRSRNCLTSKPEYLAWKAIKCILSFEKTICISSFSSVIFKVSQMLVTWQRSISKTPTVTTYNSRSGNGASWASRQRNRHNQYWSFRSENEIEYRYKKRIASLVVTDKYQSWWGRYRFA